MEPNDLLPQRYVKATFGGRRIFIQVSTKQPNLLGGYEVDKSGDFVERKVTNPETGEKGYSRNIIVGEVGDFTNVVEYRISKKYGELVRLAGKGD